MRYTCFVIRNYRAITGPLEIDLKKRPLIPTVGINESGKTTILHAILAFDSYNDAANSTIRHLDDLSNLYRTSSPSPAVTAEIEISVHELKRCIAACEKEHANHQAVFQVMKNRRRLPTKIFIRRDIATRKYSLPNQNFGSAEVQDVLARRIVARAPYILYFDDFRDKIPEKIEVPAKKSDGTTNWLDIVQQLFKQTDESFSVFQLAEMEVRQRKTVLAKVQRRLNDTLTKEWQSFHLDNREVLKIALDFELGEGEAANNYIKLDVVETDGNGDEHFFFISDRSKGFYWFFNFVMKLEFNPKISVSTKEAGSIYLLDEPGSYLHAFAQRKLCLKLRQLSEKNVVIYCTHSHYLLDPETIPIGSIVVADKDDKSEIKLTKMIDYRGTIEGNRSALQPVLDALMIRPYALDLIQTRLTVIVEGIYDYFSLELFRSDRPISILPSVGAGSIKFYISLMVAWQIKFRALWDNDDEGRRKLEEATELFGSETASRFFRQLPLSKPTGKRIIQNLYDGGDLLLMRSELGLAADCQFERTIQTLFYSSRRDEIVGKISSSTKDNFEHLFESLSLNL